MKYFSGIILSLISLILSFSLLSPSVLTASEYDIYKKAIENLRNERDYYKEKYTDEVVENLDKRSYRGKTYRRYLRLMYAAMNQVEGILQERLENSNVTQAQDYKAIVFLDAGHGGDDPGATVPPCISDRSKMRFSESDITFEVSTIAKKVLEAEGYIVVLMRQDISEGYSLFLRSVFCRSIQPDIAVSIHLNSSQYAYPVYDRPDTALPELDYTRVYVWGPSPEDLLYPFYKNIHIRIQKDDSRSKSLFLADNIANALKKSINIDFSISPELQVRLAEVKQLREELSAQMLAKKASGFPVKVYDDIFPEDIMQENISISECYKNDVAPYPGVEAADYHFVREMPSIPSVLVESLFISCPQEQILMDEKRKKDIASGISKGIIHYFENLEQTLSFKN